MYDINPLIITSGTSRYHQETKRLVIEIIFSEAAKDELCGDKQKDGQLHINSYELDSIRMLELGIDNGFKFDMHIRRRTQKATAAYQAMTHLQNAKGGITPTATRNIHTCMVRAIFTYTSEIWHHHT